MTLNKKTIKSVCSHMSQSGPRWGAGPWPPNALGKINSNLCSIHQEPCKIPTYKGKELLKMDWSPSMM